MDKIKVMQFMEHVWFQYEYEKNEHMKWMKFRQKKEEKNKQKKQTQTN